MKGTVFPVDIETGDIVSGITMIDAEGWRIIKERKQREADRALRKADHGPLGRFYLAACRSNQFDGLTPQDVTRLVYLASFMGFDGRLMLTERVRIKVSDFPEVLRLSKSTVTRFWVAVKNRFILEQPDGSLLMTHPFFRGRTKNVKERLTKLFIDAVRLVYQHTPVSQHKVLGYVFQILELVSVEFNIVCWNPLETNLGAIHPLSIKEFCKVAGYDISQSARLVRSLSKIKLPVNNCKQHLFAFVSVGNMKNDQFIVINPRILYAGHNYERVDILAAFFKEENGIASTILK